MYDVLDTTLKHTPNRIDIISFFFFLPHFELVGSYFPEQGLTLDHSSESRVLTTGLPGDSLDDNS